MEKAGKPAFFVKFMFIVIGCLRISAYLGRYTEQLNYLLGWQMKVLISILAFPLLFTVIFFLAISNWRVSYTELPALGANFLFFAAPHLVFGAWSKLTTMNSKSVRVGIISLNCGMAAMGIYILSLVAQHFVDTSLLWIFYFPLEAVLLFVSLYVSRKLSKNNAPFA